MAISYVLFYLKLVLSRNASKKIIKKNELLLTDLAFSPGEIFDLHVKFSEHLRIDTNTYNILNQKANSYI